CCIPCTLASAAVWTRRAGGNDAVALLVMMITNLTSFVVTPLSLRWLTGVVVREEVSRDILRDLVLLVVLPIIAAQLARLAYPIARWATAHKAALGTLAQCGVLSFIAVGAVTSAVRLNEESGHEKLSTNTWAAMIFAVAAVHTAGLALGYALAA